MWRRMKDGYRPQTNPLDCISLRYIKSKATADTRHEAVSPEMRELLRDYQEESDSNRRFSERIRNGIQ